MSSEVLDADISWLSQLEQNHFQCATQLYSMLDSLPEDPQGMDFQMDLWLDVIHTNLQTLRYYHFASIEREIGKEEAAIYLQ